MKLNADTLFTHAQHWATKGWRLIPITPGNKTPPTGFSWVDQSSCQPTVINSWFGETGSYRGFNIACHLQPSGMQVFDIDVKDLNRDGWAEVGEIVKPYLDDVLWARTPSGGVHIFFKAVDGIRKGGIKGVDMMGQMGSNSYVLLTPSVIQTEGSVGEYQWGSNKEVTEWVPELLALCGKTRGGNGAAGPAFTPSEIDNVRLWEALHYVDPDLPYSEWLVILQGIHSTGAPWAFEMAQRWSVGEIWQQKDGRGAGSAKYRSGDLEVRWDGFNADGGVTVGSVFGAARDAGWTGSMHGAAQLFGEVEAGKVEAALYPHTSAIPPECFPDVTYYKNRPPAIKATLGNLGCLMEGYGIEARYNAISRQVTATAPWFTLEGRGDAEAELLLEKVRSQMALCVVPERGAGSGLLTFARENTWNPVTDYMRGLTWDGEDHIAAMCEGIVVPYEQRRVRGIVVPLWLVQCCAAADMAEHCLNEEALPKYEYVLVFRAEQGIRKTTWLTKLVPPSLRPYFKTGALIDPKDKDSIMKCTGSWIVELGEIDAMFRQTDLAKLKAFFSEEEDEFRPPYGRANSRWARHTSFAGTVNNPTFLSDSTGNRRYWPLEVSRLDTRINYDGVWAQAWDMYSGGAQWWPSDEQEDLLDLHRVGFEDSSESPIVQTVLARYKSFDPEWKDLMGVRSLTCREILIECLLHKEAGEQRHTRALGSWMQRHNLDRQGAPDVSAGRGTRLWRVPKI